MSRNHTLAGIVNPRDVRPGSTASQDVESTTAKKPSTRKQSLLRVMSSFLSLMAMCCFSAAISYTNANYRNLNGNGDWTDGLALVSPLLAMLFNPLMVLRNLFKSRKTHTVLRVGVDVIIFALAVPALVYAVGGGIFWYWRPVIKSTDGSIDCTLFFNAFSRDCAPVAYTIGHLQIAGSVFLALVALTHAALAAMGILDRAREIRDAARKRLTRAFEMEESSSAAAARKAYDIERAVESRDGGNSV